MMNLRVVLAAPMRDEGQSLGLSLQGLLRAVTMNNQEFLRDSQLPPLYESGIPYVYEPPEDESIRDIPATIKRGGGDCAHLSAWRVAELRNAGESEADYNIVWYPNRRGGYNYHVRVRRADGRIEDPVIALARI